MSIIYYYTILQLSDKGTWSIVTLRFWKLLFVTVTKSGNLQNEVYERFLVNVIKPICEKKNKFLQILHSHERQTSNPAHYNEKCLDENDKLACLLKIIQPKCTSLCQPCDVYFHRQVKITLEIFRIAHLS
jgi:hypothetical protein